ncbi:protein of unknown function [Pararobbsia alpina]
MTLKVSTEILNVEHARFLDGRLLPYTERPERNVLSVRQGWTAVRHKTNSAATPAPI